MSANPEEPEMVYTSSDPNLNILASGYQEALANNNPFFDSCAISYDDRRNLWPGKSWDMRKQSVNAFPWKGASDNEVNVVGERVDTFISLLMQSFTRSNIRAMPTSVSAASRAGQVSGFLKWMQSTYIPNYKTTKRLGANHLLEKGIQVSYVCWKRERRSRLQLMSLDELAAVPEIGQELVEMILSGEADDILADTLMAQFKVTEKRAKKAIRQLRAKGEAEMPIFEEIECPVVEALSPDADVIFPSWTMDPQEAPYFFIRKLMTAQMLEKKAASEGWDEDWVEYAIKHLRGQDADVLTGEQANQGYQRILNDNQELILVVYAYQRLIDEEDGSEGIYCTVFNPRYTDKCAHHELMNGMDDYPIVVDRLNHSEKCLYEATPMTRNLRGPQMQIKTEVDSRIDRASMATHPPLMHPANNRPTDFGPGRFLPYRRAGEIMFGPTPPYDPGSKEMEIVMRQQADKAVGLDMESPLASIRQQDVVDIFLSHDQKVLAMAWKLYQRLGPDEVFYRVSGDPEGKLMQKGDPKETYDIVVSYDTTSTGEDYVKEQVAAYGTIMQFDTDGVINRRRYTEALAYMINPVFADYVLQTQEESTQEITKAVTDDLSKIFAGIEVPARANGAGLATQIIEGYAQQPDVAERLQGDEAFAERLTKYLSQYQFQMQQAQNAVTGRIGTQQANVSGISTQGMNVA